jgi:hypothetical protein
MIINTVEKKYDLTNNFHVYKVTYENSNIEKFVPLNEANADYQAIQEWAAIEGNNIIDPGA